METMILVCGALLGFFSVAFGAYSEHSLRPIVTDEIFRSLMTAIRYNQINAVITSAIGIAIAIGGKLPLQNLGEMRMFRLSGYLFILGTLLFSFSIYLSVIINLPNLVYLTPFGGITMMIAWLTLVTSGLLALKKTTVAGKTLES